MDSLSSDALQTSVISCDCRNCDDYVDQNNGDLACGSCGCLPTSHRFMKPLGEETDQQNSDTLSRLPLLDLTDVPSVDVFDSAASGKKKKRPLDSSGIDLTKNLKGSGEPIKKKPKMVTSGGTGMDDAGIFQLKPCTMLQRSHLPFLEIGDIPTSTRGVYKIAYNYKTIYVGSSSCYLRQALRSHFSGNGQKELYDFIKCLCVRRISRRCLCIGLMRISMSTTAERSPI